MLRRGGAILRYSWRGDVVAGYGADVGCARELHDDVEIVAQIFEHALRAQTAAKRQPVENRTPARHHIGAQRQRTEHVLTAADAS